nr:DUF433 domain-containing protein [Lusitaniella coriacea]
MLMQEQTMQLEDYFDVLQPDDISLKGTRIGIEHILDEYVNFGKSPEAIAEQFPTVTLEQVYATILYYLRDRETVGQYLEDWVAYTTKAQQKHDRNLPPVVVRLRQLKAEREKATIS